MHRLKAIFFRTVAGPFDRRLFSKLPVGQNKWQIGRQDTGYEKLTLFLGSWPVSFDGYLLRYAAGSYLKPHIDPVTAKRHYRLNIVLRSASSGGEFIVDKAIINGKYIKLFRPDKFEHSLTPVVGRTRYVLSLGCAL